MNSDLAATAGTKSRGVRKYGRVFVDTSVLVFRNSLRPVLAKSCDIGCRGMSFYASLELAEGDIVKLEFELPYSKMRFGVSAVVRDRNGARYGVEFQQLTPEEFGEIAQVTAALSFLHH